jgi:phage-related protein
MTQPTFALPCQYSLTVERGVRTKRVQFGDGYEQVSPESLNDDMRSYSIETVPIPDNTAIALDKQFAQLKGDFFYSQFFMDEKKYKYRLEPNQWQWRVLGPNSNTFTFTVKRIYDPRT